MVEIGLARNMKMYVDIYIYVDIHIIKNHVSLIFSSLDNIHVDDCCVFMTTHHLPKK